MILYWKIMLNALQSSTFYRFNTFFTSCNKILNLLVQVSLWTALYHGNYISGETEGISLDQMLVYVTLSTIISIIVQNNNIGILSSKVSTGEIAINLIRPIGLFRATLFEQLGSKLFVFIFEALPLLLIGTLLLNMNVPDYRYLFIFIVFLILSFMVFFLMTYLLGLLSFWYLRVFHLDFMLSNLITFFSGAWIPIWFFPHTLQKATMLLPFELIYFTPIRTCMGEIDFVDIKFVFMKYFVYIVLLSLLNVGVWRLGIKKLVIQGG
ncbi:ABC transporter permease [Cohnella soli]|uniref:ABC transporter permease n=1 Tax=Cohnella soli TaxID=425005 RepID=A0ABW0HWH0_9BACL